MVFALAVSLCIAAINIIDSLLYHLGVIPPQYTGIFGAITAQVRLVLTSDVMNWLKNTCSLMYFFFPKSMILIILGGCAAILVIRIALAIVNLLWP